MAQDMPPPKPAPKGTSKPGPKPFKTAARKPVPKRPDHPGNKPGHTDDWKRPGIQSLKGDIETEVFKYTEKPSDQELWDHYYLHKIPHLANKPPQPPTPDTYNKPQKAGAHAEIISSIPKPKPGPPGESKPLSPEHKPKPRPTFTGFLIAPKPPPLSKPDTGHTKPGSTMHNLPPQVGQAKPDQTITQRIPTKKIKHGE